MFRIVSPNNKIPQFRFISSYYLTRGETKLEAEFAQTI